MYFIKNLLITYPINLISGWALGPDFYCALGPKMLVTH